ncbi:MAG: ATP-dependent Clp protease adaptor ClpS [Pseudomonadota bacterium]
MSKAHIDLEEKLLSTTKDKVEEPPQYKVLMHNDHYTTMDFVVQVLETIFNKPPVEAVQIMLTIHTQGIGMCGSYTAEVAETKVAHVHLMAKEHGFPLMCSMEEA